MSFILREDGDRSFVDRDGRAVRERRQVLHLALRLPRAQVDRAQAQATPTPPSGEELDNGRRGGPRGGRGPEIPGVRRAFFE